MCIVRKSSRLLIKSPESNTCFLSTSSLRPARHNAGTSAWHQRGSSWRENIVWTWSKVNSHTYLEPERFRYWQGQMLRSRDFNDQTARAAEMRWWHNRAIHRAFGVCLGLEISAILGNNNSLLGVHVNTGI